jgi:hypothetical protein
MFPSAWKGICGVFVVIVCAKRGAWTQVFERRKIRHFLKIFLQPSQNGNAFG